VNAEEALRIGLANVVLPDDGFDDAVAAYAARIAAGPPVAHALTKRLLLATWDAPLEAHLREELTHIRTTFATGDVQEALAAFREKRPPHFRGD
jgi:2-(1,2-epoxy-1,2-dihydrophenyl)acetyl-CoA isomerase